MDTYDKGMKPTNPNQKPETNNSRLWSGLFIIAVGLVFLAHKAGYHVPSWIFSWKTLLLAIGFYVGARQSFKPGGWMIAVLLGCVFIADDYVDTIYLKPYIIPIAIIGVGLYTIFKPRKSGDNFWKTSPDQTTYADGQNFESVSIFGGNKSIISKDFKGGEVVTIFGGTELNMSQADIQGVVTLEVVQIFGGTKLIVPANWKVNTGEVVSVLGGIDDKRPTPTNVDDTKVLNIKGTSIFAGIDIRSY